MAGIKDVGIIDLVTSTDNELKLIMVENREWGSDNEMYEELQEKLNNYLVYIEDGQLERDYPNDINLSRVIQLDSTYEPSDYALNLIGKIESLLRDRGINFIFHRLNNN